MSVFRTDKVILVQYKVRIIKQVKVLSINSLKEKIIFSGELKSKLYKKTIFLQINQQLIL